MNLSSAASEAMKYVLLERDFSNPHLSHSIILRRIGRGQRVLDVGCAHGNFARWLREQECYVVGLEIDRNLAAMARTYCDDVIVGDIQNTDLRRSLQGPFDIILLADVLEHMIDPWTVMKSIRPLLRSGGRVLVSVPNVAFLPVRMKLLLGGDFEYSEAGGIMDINHLRWFTYKTIKKLLLGAGYSIESSVGAPFCVRGGKVRRIPLLGEIALKASWVCSAFLAHLLPGLFAYQIVVEGIREDV